jgi:hypothetical protein
VIRFPLRYVSGNVLIGPSGEAAALYRLQTTAYPYLPVPEKRALAARLVRFAHAVAADFTIWRVQRTYPADQYVAELEASADDRHTDLDGWRRFLQGHQNHLAASPSHLPEVYLAVTLTDHGETVLGQGLISSFDRARRRLEELFRVDQPRPISGKELEKLAEVERRTFHRVGGVLGLRRAKTTEIQWLLRRGATRGIGEPSLDAHWEPDALRVEESDGSTSYEPLEHDLIRCVNEPMSEDPAESASLTVEAETGTSYQARRRCSRAISPSCCSVPPKRLGSPWMR